MTVTTETNRVSYNGDDSTVIFAVPFYFLLDTSIAVTLVAADDTETTQVLNTDYTVTDAGVLTGGSITMSTAPATGERLVIIRSESLTQTTDYIENDDFPAASHERALDKAMMINQQQQEEIARCITAPVGDDGTTDYTLPVYEASSFLQWHPTLKELRNAELTATGTATIGTDAGDLVELVEVGSGVAGWPALALDNMTFSGVTVGDVVTKNHGTASGQVPLNSDLGTASLVDHGTASGNAPLNSDLGTASLEDHGTGSGEIPLNSDLSGRVLQTISSLDAGVASGTTAMNSDNTIPQITEGDQYLTRTFTAGANTNPVKIEVLLNCSASAAGNNRITVALFKDSVTDAVISTQHVIVASANAPIPLTFHYPSGVGSTSEITFTVRMGGSGGGTFYVNGNSGGQLYNGTMYSSIVITEYQA